VVDGSCFQTQVNLTLLRGVHLALVHKHLSLLLAATGLLGGLSDLTGTRLLLLDRLDDTDSDGLSHVTHSESSQWGVVGESLHAHGLGWLHLHQGGVTRLNLLGVSFQTLAGTTIDLLYELVESAGDMGGMAIYNRAVTLADLTRVVQDDDLSFELIGLLCGVVLGVRANIATFDFLDGDVLDVEANVVTGLGLL